MPAPRKETSRPVSTFRAASSARGATSSGSDRGGSRSSGRPRRTPFGICSKSSSTESTPIVASICWRSASVSERKLMSFRGGLLVFEQLPVRGGVQKGFGLGRVAQPDLDQPALAVRILVDGLGRFHDLLVDLDHLAGNRRDHFRDGFDGLDLAVARILRDRRTLLRRLVVDELAERVLSEPRDPESCLVPLDAHPVVFLVVLELVGVALSRRHSGIPPSCRSVS